MPHRQTAPFFVPHRSYPHSVDEYNFKSGNPKPAKIIAERRLEDPLPRSRACACDAFMSRAMSGWFLENGTIEEPSVVVKYKALVMADGSRAELKALDATAISPLHLSSWATRGALFPASFFSVLR